MPNVVSENTDKQSLIFTIEMPSDSYANDFKKELKNYSKKANFKGFRKGKVPISFVRKNYGKSILADFINKTIQESIYEFMNEGGDKYLGQPIPVNSDSDEQYSFNTTNLEDFEFKFEIGLKPDFKVSLPTNSFAYNDVKIPTSIVDEEIENARKRAGERELDTDKIEEGDLVRFDAKELDGDTVKEDGVHNQFSLLWERIADEDLKKELLTKKTGDTVRFNVFTAEKETTADYTKKYLLGIEDETVEVGEMFEATIDEVSRIKPAELTEKFFTSTFGEEIKTKEAASELIKKEVKKSFIANADALLFRDVQKELMDSHLEKITLPDDFLKRFLRTQSEENTPENVEKGYEGFANNLRWTLIRSQLFDKYEIKITEQDLRENFRNRIIQYMGGYANHEMIEATINRMMENQESVEETANTLATEQLMLKIKDDLNLEVKETTPEEFNKIIEKVNKQVAEEREANQEEE